MEISFPFAGLHTGLATEHQPPTTSPNLSNVRPFDVEEGRARGGQRPGLVLAYTTRIGGDYPVLHISTITTTYITPA